MHEFGVRAALGATPGQLRRSILYKAAGHLLVGLVLGLTLSLTLTRLIGLTTTAADIRVYVMVGLLLSGVALIACYLPAWRATKIDPSRALRSD